MATTDDDKRVKNSQWLLTWSTHHENKKDALGVVVCTQYAYSSTEGNEVHGRSDAIAYLSLHV
jgi:hypothetical protein